MVCGSVSAFVLNVEESGSAKTLPRDGIKYSRFAIVQIHIRC